MTTTTRSPLLNLSLALCAQQLSARQIAILACFKAGKSITETAAACCISTAAMTGQIDRLVKFGYLSRIYGADPQDRRICQITVMPKGDELLARMAATAMTKPKK